MPRPTTLPDTVTILRGLAETISRIGAVAQRLTSLQLQDSLTPGVWSPNQILWHIRATGDDHIDHVQRILNEDEPHWRHVSPRARMKKKSSRYDLLPFAESFTAFQHQREALVAQLSAIPATAWQRFGVINVPYQPDRPVRATVHQIVAGMVAHERGHCREMEQLAADLAPSGPEPRTK
jgi:hypothetical protein